MQTDRVGGGVKNRHKNLGSYTPRPPGHRHLHVQPPSQFVTGSTSRSTSVLRRCCVKVLKLSCLGFPWQRWCFAELICSLNADERGEHKLHYIWSRTARELRHGPSLTVDEVVQSGALTEIQGRAGQDRKGSGVENMFTSQWSPVWKPEFLQTKYKNAKQKLYSINFNNNFLNERNQTIQKGMTLAWLKLLPTPHPTSRALSLKSLPTV